MTESRTTAATAETPRAWHREELAGFWLRVTALGVDLVVVLVVAVLLAVLLVPALVGVVVDLGAAVDEQQLTWGLVAGLGALILVLYDVLATSGAGGTLGKRAAGIEVRDAATGERVEPGVAAGRMITRVLSLAPLALGFLWAGWSRRKQTWHDQLAGTVVVRRRHLPVELRWPDLGPAPAAPMLALGSGALAESSDPDATDASATTAAPAPADTGPADQPTTAAAAATAADPHTEAAAAEAAGGEGAGAEGTAVGAAAEDAEPAVADAGASVLDGPTGQADEDAAEPWEEVLRAERAPRAGTEPGGEEQPSSALDEDAATPHQTGVGAEPEPAREPEPEPEAEPAQEAEPEPEPEPAPAGTDRGDPSDPNVVAIHRASLAPESARWLEQVAEQVDPRLDAVTAQWRSAPQGPAARACAFGLLIGYLATMYPHMQPDLHRTAEAHPSFSTLPESERLTTLQSIASDTRRAAAWIGPLIEVEDPDQVARLLD